MADQPEEAWPTALPKQGALVWCEGTPARSSGTRPDSFQMNLRYLYAQHPPELVSKRYEDQPDQPFTEDDAFVREVAELTRPPFSRAVIISIVIPGPDGEPRWLRRPELEGQLIEALAKQGVAVCGVRAKSNAVAYVDVYRLSPDGTVSKETKEIDLTGHVEFLEA